MCDSGGVWVQLKGGILQEVEVLRRQVDILSEENGKLVGHQNHRQKIEYLVKLKKDNTKLMEVLSFRRRVPADRDVPLTL